MRMAMLRVTEVIFLQPPRGTSVPACLRAQVGQSRMNSPSVLRTLSTQPARSASPRLWPRPTNRRLHVWQPRVVCRVNPIARPPRPPPPNVKAQQPGRLD